MAVGVEGRHALKAPQLREQHVPQAIGLPPGSPREKVKPIVYPLAAGPAARSKGGHCSTLPRQCCHMGNRRNSNLQPTKSKANNPAWYLESGHFGLAVFNITTEWNRGHILLPLRLIIWGGHKFIGLNRITGEEVRGPDCVNDNRALVTLGFKSYLKSNLEKTLLSFSSSAKISLKGTKRRKWIHVILSDLMGHFSSICSFESPALHSVVMIWTEWRKNGANHDCVANDGNMSRLFKIKDWI